MFYGHGDYLVRFIDNSDEPDSLFLRLRFSTNYLSRPRWMRSSISSFRWMQSSVKCLRHLWNRQYLVLSTPFFSCEGAFGRLTQVSFRSDTSISGKVFSLDMAKGVYLVKRPVGPLLSRATLPSFFFSYMRQDPLTQSVSLKDLHQISTVVVN